MSSFYFWHWRICVLMRLNKGAFNNCSFLKTIYYQGSMEEWEAMSIDLEENKDLIYAVRYYYSETKPTESGNFWHYGKDGEIAEW